MTDRVLSPQAEQRLIRLEQRNRQRARRMGCDFERVDFIAVCEAQGWACRACGQDMDPELPHTEPMAISLEHSIALSCGGKHTADQIEGMHTACNKAKGAAIDTPRAAKVKRQKGEKGQRARRNKAKANGAHRAIPSRPLAGTRASGWRKKMSGEVENR